jgi:hypothetical protein
MRRAVDVFRAEGTVLAAAGEDAQLLQLGNALDRATGALGDLSLGKAHRARVGTHGAVGRNRHVGQRSEKLATYRRDLD